MFEGTRRGFSPPPLPRFSPISEDFSTHYPLPLPNLLGTESGLFASPRNVDKRGGPSKGSEGGRTAGAHGR